MIAVPRDNRPTWLGCKASDPAKGRNRKAEVEHKEEKKAFCLPSLLLPRSNPLSSHSKQFDLGLVPADTQWKSCIPSSSHSGLGWQIWGKKHQNSPGFRTAQGTIHLQLTIHSFPTSPLESCVWTACGVTGHPYLMLILFTCAHCRK